MSVYWNDRVRGIDPYVPGEQPRDRKYVKLNTNENPYPPSPKTLEAIKAAAADSLRLYSDPVCLDLRKAIAERYGTSAERVFVGNGSDEILAFAFGAFYGERSDAGAKGGAGSTAAPLLFPDITYSFYPVYAKLWNIPYETVPLREDFVLRVEDYLRPSGGVVFPNPNAPTSRALSLAEVLSVVDYQAKADQVVLVDEAYVDFGAESAVPYVASRPNLLTVHTLSKSRSLAGLRVGFAIGQEELIEGLNRVKDSFNSYTLDRCALAGAQRSSVYELKDGGCVGATRLFGRPFERQFPLRLAPRDPG
jgi:histidinol-phosphate aminotransferase